MKTNTFKTLLCLTLILILQQGLNGQNAYTLKQAQDYAVLNSYKTRTASLDLLNTIAKKNQFIATGLPQVNAQVSYQNYLSLPTQLIPNFVYPGGPDLELTFGKYNNMTASATASQLVIDGSFFVGLKAAALFVDLSKKAVEKSHIDIKASVAEAYFLVLVAQENRNILDSTYIKMNEILIQSKEFVKNGFMEQTDVDQMELNVSNLKSKLEMADRNIDLSYNLLKFQMGIDIDENISLSDDLYMLLDQAIATNLIDKQLDESNNIDIKLVKGQEFLLKQNVKVDKAKYYPSLNLFFNTQFTAQRNKFDFYDFSKGNKWYNSNLIGLTLSIPIWSSGIRSNMVKMDKISVAKQEILVKQVSEGLKMDLENSRVSLKTYTDQYYVDRKNLELSVKIYNKTYVKYTEGISSSMDLNQAYLQVLTEEGDYISTIFQLLNNYIKISKILNNL